MSNRTQLGWRDRGEAVALCACSAVKGEDGSNVQQQRASWDV
jgi:hypothetical protein